MEVYRKEDTLYIRQSPFCLVQVILSVCLLVRSLVCYPYHEQRIEFFLISGFTWDDGL